MSVIVQESSGGSGTYRTVRSSTLCTERLAPHRGFGLGGRRARCRWRQRRAPLILDLTCENFVSEASSYSMAGLSNLVYRCVRIPGAFLFGVRAAVGSATSHCIHFHLQGTHPAWLDRHSASIDALAQHPTWRRHDSSKKTKFHDVPARRLQPVTSKPQARLTESR